MTIMKKFLFAVACAALLLGSCNKNEETKPEAEPKLTLTSQSEVSVSFEGAEVKVTYTLENPVENGEITASAEGADWCSDFNCGTEGEVSFTVAANDGDERTCDVKVTYTYGDAKTKSFSVKVSQAAAGDPNLKLTSESEVSVGNDGGDVTVTYTVEDPAEDGVMTAEADADWCTLSSEEDGTVTFAVAANNGEARACNITLTYTYGGGKTKTATVKVSQEAFVAPVITVTSESEVSVSFDGGDVTVAYTLENPVDGGKMSVAADADWCTLTSEEDGTATFAVAANEGAARTCNITVTYTYREDQTVTASVKVSQEEVIEFDFEFDAPMVYGSYYGDGQSNNPGEMMYQLIFADNETLWTPSATYYVVTLFAGEPEDMNAIAPPAGTYTMTPTQSSTATDKGTIYKNTDYTYAVTMTASGAAYPMYFLVSGTCKITANGNGEYTYDFQFKTARNTMHRMRYTGPIALEDATQPEEPAVSNLTESVDLTDAFSEIDAGGIFWGTYNEKDKGIQEWVVEFKNKADYYDYRTLMLTFYMPSTNTFEEGLIPGEYSVSETVAENSVRAGWIKTSQYQGSSLSGSWYYIRPYSDGTTAGPMVGGTVKIEKNGDGTYNFIIDGYDDSKEQHAIKATFNSVELKANDYSWL